MPIKQSYRYDPVTRLYTGEAPAFASPREAGIYLLPAHATFEAPPALSANETAHWDGARWEVIADWRGHTYYTPAGVHVEIAEAGIEPPADALPEPPPPTWGQRVTAATQTTVWQANRMRRAAVGGASELEVAGWGDKAAIAARVLAGTATSDEVASEEVEASARGRGETAAQLAQRQIALATWYRLARAAIDGWRDATLDAIDDATADTLDSVMATQISAAETQINTLLADRP